jgi:hypothetical protein
MQAEIDEVLQDPATSYWLKSALISALRRDPVDAVNDAEWLYDLLTIRLYDSLHNAVERK